MTKLLYDLNQWVKVTNKLLFMSEKPQTNMPDSARQILPDKFDAGEWRVDSSLLTLSNASGQIIKLEPKMMSVLVYLAESSGRSVSRDELERGVWQDMVVSYDALTSAINKLRKALGDDSSHPSYIKTIPTKGYCFIAPISFADNAQPATDLPVPDLPEPGLNDKKSLKLSKWINFKWIIAGLVLLAVLLAAWIVSIKLGTYYPQKQPSQNLLSYADHLPTLVVLPFDDLNQQAGQTYFSDGITADITTALSKLSGLFVISWKSASTLPDNSTHEIRNIAQDLKVRYVLQGSLRRTENRVRINAQLIDATTGINLWAERYDREIKTVLDLQGEIAAEIATALSITLTEQEKLLQSRRYTTDIHAYDKFLQGQAAYVRSNREDNLLARSLFQAAIDIDREFVRAYAAVALTYADEYRFRWSHNPTQSLARAFELASQAVEMDNQSPQAYWVLGYVYLHKKDYGASIKKTRISIQLDPNHSDSYVMLALSTMYNGDPESAIRLVNKAMNLNPHYPARYPSVLGQAHFYLGRYDEAIYPLREATKRNIELITPRIYLIAALEQTGLHEEAVWETNQLKVSVPGFSVNNIPRILPHKDQAKTQAIMQLLSQAGL